MRRIGLMGLIGLMAGSAFAQEFVTLSVTNSDPNTPRINFTGAMIRRNAYQVNVFFRSFASNALDISGMTVELNWKPSTRLQDSPVNKIVGTVANGTGGHARVYILKDQLNSVGDTIFQMKVYDSTNRASAFFQSVVYDSVDQVSDDEYVPATMATNYYTQAQIDAILTNFMDISTANGRYVNESNGVVSAVYVVPTGTTYSTISGTNAEQLIRSADLTISNRYTKSESEARYLNFDGDSVTGGNFRVEFPGNLIVGRNSGFTTSTTHSLILSYIGNNVYGDDTSPSMLIEFQTLDQLNQSNLYLFAHSYPSKELYFGSSGLTATNGKIWRLDNDGSGSRMDADLFDGADSTQFVQGVELNGVTNKPVGGIVGMGTMFQVVTNQNMSLITPTRRGHQVYDAGSNKLYTAVGATTNDWKGATVN